ncbi:type IV fimbrial biogenesis protein FimT [Microbulbifer donghaiensis]|uniref:Type II secretion system protein H n=1 Tax=Microbulbifer donghaiensis TaxID=494016 RepID=A0A1M5HWQ5_9GAMM|nr:GspH/FimT family pseudopilin [Microbulbifer donghaiensis]SHG20394.1 type IV fimbrial biogenesis protein FimT [Microbulbifer donghaiensis]
MQTLPRVSGYTLIELMLTITILAIVAAVATPPMADFISRYQTETAGRQLFELINFSRGKAYSHGQVYTLCPSADGQSCSSDWSSGALLFVDSNGDGQRAAAEKIERIMPKMATGATLEWRSFNSKKYLQFRPNGLTLSQNGNFAYCPPSQQAEKGWIIVINATGRPYFGKDSDSDGIVESGSGKNLTCTNAD